jgi:hypothetical protein
MCNHYVYLAEIALTAYYQSTVETSDHEIHT